MRCTVPLPTPHSRATLMMLGIIEREDRDMHFIVHKDFVTRERVGPGGTFQIASLSIEDLDGNSADISKLVDQGRHFHSDEELLQYISERLSIFAANIDLTAK
jgi:hypothetical protein